MSRDKLPENDDIALFRQEVSDAEPIHHNKRVITPKDLPKAVVRNRSDEGNPDRLAAFSDMFANNDVGNEEFLEFRRPGIQHRQFAKLRSGKVHSRTGFAWFYRRTRRTDADRIFSRMPATTNPLRTGNSWQRLELPR